MSDQASAVAASQPANAAEQSIETRLAGLFGGKDAEPAAPEPEQPGMNLAEPEAAEGAPAEGQDEAVEAAAEPAEVELEIEWNGEKRTLRGDELKSIAQKGFDAEHKWAEAARAREWVQNQHAMLQQAVQFQQSFMEDVAELKSYDSQLRQYEQINWMQLFDSDPVSALKYKEQRDSLREVRNAKVQELTGKQQQLAQAQAQAAHVALQAEERALLSKIPEWRNPEKAQAEKAMLRDWLGTNGFTSAEVSQVADHRVLLLARKAMLYDQLQKGKATAVKQVRDAPPVAKPGSANSANPATARQQEVRARLRKSGDVKDAAAVILSRMR